MIHRETSDARAERERDEARERARLACQRLIEVFGADGPENVERAAERAASAYIALAAKLAEAREAARPLIDETSEVEVTDEHYNALRLALAAPPSDSLARVRAAALREAAEAWDAERERRGLVVSRPSSFSDWLRKRAAKEGA